MSRVQERLCLVPLPGRRGGPVEVGVGLRWRHHSNRDEILSIASHLLIEHGPDRRAVVLAPRAAYFPARPADLQGLLRDCWQRRQPSDACLFDPPDAQLLQARLQGEANPASADAWPGDFRLRLLTDPLNGWISLYSRLISLNRLLGTVADECLARGYAVDLVYGDAMAFGVAGRISHFRHVNNRQ